MTALIIIGSILLFLFLVLLIPVKVQVQFDGEFHAVLKILFFHLNLTEPTEKTETATEKKETGKEKETPEKGNASFKDKLRNFFKREGIRGVLSFVTDLAKLLLHTTGKLLKHVQFRRFRLQICIASGDAYDTALLYGETCTAVAGAYTALFNSKKCRDKSASVTCDFTAEESTGSFSCTLSLRILWIVSEAVSLLWRAIPVLRRFNRSSGPLPPKPNATADE